jgi:CHAD domain-containing protein
VIPGLAGFIAAGDDDRQTGEDCVEAALAALATEFTVVRERGGEPGGRPANDQATGRRRTWLDTFDWRLHKAGLTLEYVAGHRGGELRLTAPARAASVPASSSGLTNGAAAGGPVSRSAADRSAANGAAANGANAATTATATTATVTVTAAAGTGTGTVQPVARWTATRPHLLPDLPEGPVTARIAGLVAPRALLPVAAVVGTTSLYRLLNEDDKTVARLVVERLTIPGADAPLAPRLTITEVRGYPAQARRAARLIAAVPRVRTAAEPPMTAALRALGRHPGDYSNKVDAAITAAMPAPRAAARILLRLLNTIDANVAGVLKDTDTEFLHDLRVSVRRTRSALKLFGDVLTGPANRANKAPKASAWLTKEDLAFFAAEFKWVGDVTTPTRDLDVHLLDFGQMARGLAAAKPDDLEPFRGYLEERRRAEFRALARALRTPRFAALTANWRERLTAIERMSDSADFPSGASGAGTVRSVKLMKAPPSAGTVGILAAERTRVSFVKVARRGAAITADSPPESLHDLRKRCKELRYALEFFAPLHDPAGYGKVVGDLKRLQDCLGEFQDTDVQIGEIRALASAMLAAGEAPAVTLLAMGEVTAGLVVRQRAARADFERRFTAFADVDGQRRMSALLRGRQGEAGRYL